MKIKFVYFDLGGVFFDFKDATKKLADILGVSSEHLQKSLSQHESDMHTGKLSPNKFWKQYQDQFGFIKADNINFGKAWVQQTTSIRLTRNLYVKVSATHQTGIITNLWANNFEPLVEKHVIPVNESTIVVDSSVVGYAKPDKRMFNRACIAAKCDPSQILLIDDLPDNVESAKECGWNGIVFETTNPRKSIEQIYSYLNI